MDPPSQQPPPHTANSAGAERALASAPPKMHAALLLYSAAALLLSGVKHVVRTATSALRGNLLEQRHAIEGGQEVVASNGLVLEAASVVHVADRE